jgi:hypothetical protein
VLEWTSLVLQIVSLKKMFASRIAKHQPLRLCRPRPELIGQRDMIDSAANRIIRDNTLTTADEY